MSDNPRVQEFNLLIAICFFGAIALFAIMFIASVGGDRQQVSHAGAATPTSR